MVILYIVRIQFCMEHINHHKHCLYEFQTFLLVTILFKLVEKMMFLLTLHVYKLKMDTVTVLSSSALDRYR